MDSMGYGRLNIVQSMNYKFLELVSAEFQVPQSDVVRKYSV
jgi:hypothetical protein